MINKQLKNSILQFATPSDETFEEFNDLLEYREINKKEFILTKGQNCKHHYFILKGCFRSFFINEKGTEKILNFGIENWWITDYDSLTNLCPTNLYIQAIENSQVLCITKENMDKALNHSLEMNRYFRIIAEKVRIADQRRMYYMFNLSGKEIYTMFCEKFPEFVQRIPLYMLASYFGLTPEFLSKIRGNG
ncbi:MAG: Crp/Fnr family transcriptional regulator [Ignavibacteria bacterium]|nr:Crp/Fnr family transcriptional regulator [Ignavibacteria bacterium]